MIEKQLPKGSVYFWIMLCEIAADAKPVLLTPVTANPTTKTNTRIKIRSGPFFITICIFSYVAD